jgi:hypothetical protein
LAGPREFEVGGRLADVHLLKCDHGCSPLRKTSGRNARGKRGGKNGSI